MCACCVRVDTCGCARALCARASMRDGDPREHTRIRVEELHRRGPTAARTPYIDTVLIHSTTPTHPVIPVSLGHLALTLVRPTQRPGPSAEQLRVPRQRQLPCPHRLSASLGARRRDLAGRARPSPPSPLCRFRLCHQPRYCRQRVASRPAPVVANVRTCVSCNGPKGWTWPWVLRNRHRNGPREPRRLACSTKPLRNTTDELQHQRAAAASDQRLSASSFAPPQAWSSRHSTECAGAGCLLERSWRKSDTHLAVLGALGGRGLLGLVPRPGQPQLLA